MDAPIGVGGAGRKCVSEKKKTVVHLPSMVEEVIEGCEGRECIVGGKASPCLINGSEVLLGRGAFKVALYPLHDLCQGEW